MAKERVQEGRKGYNPPPASLPPKPAGPYPAPPRGDSKPAKPAQDKGN
jgi:hypothetical protein